MDLSNLLKTYMQEVNTVGQASGSVFPGGAVNPPAPLYPRDPSANTFTRFSAPNSLVDPNTKEFPVRIRHRCWLAVSIHALAADDLLFNLSQDLVLSGVTGAVAAKMLAANGGWGRGVDLEAGLCIAWLMQEAQCHALIAKTDPGHTLFFQTLDLLIDEVGIHGPDFDEGTDIPMLNLSAMRTLLMFTGAVVDPTSSALRELTRPDRDAYSYANLSFDLMTAGGPVPLTTLLPTTVGAARTINVEVEFEFPAKGPPRCFNKLEEEVIGGKAYAVGYVIRHANKHFQFMWFDRSDPSADPVTVDSHVVGVTGFTVHAGWVFDQQACNIFFVRK